MPGFGKRAARLTVLYTVCSVAPMAGEGYGDWSGNYPPCDRHEEILRRDHKNLGVRFSTANRKLAAEFASAMNFWATIVDMEWYEENSQNCSIEIVDGGGDLFSPAQVARAQFPDTPAFQGWIAVNPKVALSRDEQYLLAVHELGHLLGLRHNPSARSVMFFLRVDEPVLVDAADLAVLATRHKLHVADPNRPLVVTTPKNDGRNRAPDR